MLKASIIGLVLGTLLFVVISGCGGWAASHPSEAAGVSQAATQAGTVAGAIAGTAAATAAAANPATAPQAPSIATSVAQGVDALTAAIIALIGLPAVGGAYKLGKRDGERKGWDEAKADSAAPPPRGG